MRTRGDTAFYALMVSLAVGLPIVLSLPALSAFVGAQHKPRQILEFFGLSGFLAVAWSVARATRRSTGTGFWASLGILLPAVVALAWLNVLSERTFKDWDYVCYEGAARLLLQGENPYRDCYYYPPLPALALSWTYAAIQHASAALRRNPLDGDKAWLLVFYLYQCLQWLLVVSAYFLSRRLARRYGLADELSLVAVTLLFLLNNPLLRTLHFFQVNLWVLNGVLLVLLHNSSRPVLSGLVAALGAHVKLYPALFLAPWAVSRDWRAWSALAASFLAVAVLVTRPLGDPALWLQFLEQNPTHAGGFALRDNSVHSLVSNALRVTGAIGLEGLDSWLPEFATASIVVLLGLWFVARTVARLRQGHADGEPVGGGSSPSPRDGMFVDAVALMLLVSPVAWEHHYVLAIPVALWTLAFETGRARFPAASLVGFLLIFGVPTFDVFPFSYGRLAGLVILLLAADPIRHFHGPAEDALPAGDQLRQTRRNLLVGKG